MYIVIIESPFKPSEEEVKQYEGRFSRADLLRQNIIYARLALKNSLMRGESPFASHLLYTQVWSEDEELRDAGIKAGLEMYHRADGAAHYVDLGRSAGMRKAEKQADLHGIERQQRSIAELFKGKEAREFLAPLALEGFPYLDELVNEERGSMGRIRALT